MSGSDPYPEWRLGLGFNPFLISGALPLPAGVRYIEAGAEVVLATDSAHWLRASGLEVSLHLSRAPFCETPDIQQNFAERLAETCPSWVASIGVHLCGPYREGLGAFGLGSSFPASDEAFRRAHNLLDILSSCIGRPFVIENANFYDGNIRTAFTITRFLNDLAARHDAGIILDLAHIAMNACNAGVLPEFVLGAVNFDRVNVVHLSGMRRGRDGVLHDAHSEPVADSVWSMLRTALPLLRAGTTLVIEHTDPTWPRHPDAFCADFVTLSEIIQSHALPDTKVIDQERVAIGYLARIVLPARFPDLVGRIGRDQFAALVLVWAEHFLAALSTRDRYIVLRDFERGYLGNTLSVVDSFAAFLTADPAATDRCGNPR